MDFFVVAKTTDASLMDLVLEASAEIIWFTFGVVAFRCFTKWLRSQRAPLQQPKQRKICAEAKTLDASQMQFPDWIKVRKAGVPVTDDKARALGKMLAASYPEHLHEFIEFLERHSSSFSIDSSMVNAWLSALANSGRAEHMPAFAQSIETRLGVALDMRGDELLLGAIAAISDDKVTERIDEFKSKHGVLSAGACIQLAWGYVFSKNIDEAARWTHASTTKGAAMPPRLLLQLVRAAGEVGPSAMRAVLDGLKDDVLLTSECASAMLRDCLAHEDVSTARRVQRMASDTGVAVGTHGIEALLKLYAKAHDPTAVEFLENAISNGFIASQGFCGSLLSRCAASRFTELVEAIEVHLKTHETPTLATYKTLMKAYACCGEFGRACDIFLHLEKHGPEPDDVMRGCVMKFSIFSRNMPLCLRIIDHANLDESQVFCSLIRAAGRDGEVDDVSMLIQKMDEKAGSTELDISVLNAAIEVFLGSKHVQQAGKIFERAKASGKADSRTFHTMVKGVCSHGDLDRAGRILEDMIAVGHVPEGAIYNCILGAAVAAGDLRRAWAIFRRLEQRGAIIDAYALSIMMKAAKTLRSPAEAEPFLALLDRRGVDVCMDSVLLNTALDACIQHKDEDRLTMLLDSYRRSDVSASVQTYGLLIKASSSIGAANGCVEMWNEMTGRGLQPNTMTLGCMVDALVSSQLVEDAVKLFQKWKKFVSVNTVIYSTLMKGFAYHGDAERAMEIYRELKADGLEMNLVSYTTLIDTHARAGNMDMATELLEQMERDGCQPNTITFSTLIKGHCMKGNLDNALHFFQDMMSRGLQADAVVFNTLLDGCVKHSHYELADNLLVNMSKLSVKPSPFTLSIVTKMWGKRKQLDKAFEAVRTLTMEHGLTPDAKNGTSLISACFANNSASHAMKALEEMRSWRRHRGFSGPDDSTYGALIAGLVRHGMLRKACFYAEEACSCKPSRISMSTSPSSAGVSALRMLFRELSKEGLDRELGVPILNKLEEAGEKALGIALSQVISSSPSRSRRPSWS